ncbi:MAG: hypothetical protein HW403_286 [Dehalococcoidia bacterium]|nr:hypothetical protein [Dehalococcoidia bacterium]
MNVTLQPYDQAEKAGEVPCFQCGVCCIKWQPLMDTEETEEIAAALGMSGHAFRETYTRPYPPKPGHQIMQHDSVGCVFLRFDGPRALCAIHEFKPQACQDWVASLAKSECQEGMERMVADGVVLPKELFSSEASVKTFVAAIDNQRTASQEPRSGS